MNKIFFACLLLTISPFSIAHTSDVGMMQNLLHQLTGIEHLIILMAVIMLVAANKTVDRYLMPLLFILAMSVGSFLAIQGSTTLIVEKSFTLSILFLGVLLFTREEAAKFLSKIVFTLFAFTYGLSHGIVSRMELIVDSVANQAFYKASFFSSLSLLVMVIILAFRHDAIRYVKGQMVMGYVLAFCCSAFILQS